MWVKFYLFTYLDNIKCLLLFIYISRKGRHHLYVLNLLSYIHWSYKNDKTCSFSLQYKYNIVCTEQCQDFFLPSNCLNWFSRLFYKKVTLDDINSHLDKKGESISFCCLTLYLQAVTWLIMQSFQWSSTFILCTRLDTLTVTMSFRSKKVERSNLNSNYFLGYTWLFV